MTATAPPSLSPELDEIEQLEALIEEARRRTRRRRRWYGAVALLAALAGGAAYAGFTPAMSSTPLADTPPPIDSLQVPTTLRNGALTIMAVEANAKHEGLPGWYGLSAIGPMAGGRCSSVVRTE